MPVTWLIKFTKTFLHTRYDRNFFTFLSCMSGTPLNAKAFRSSRSLSFSSPGGASTICSIRNWTCNKFEFVNNQKPKLAHVSGWFDKKIGS